MAEIKVVSGKTIIKKITVGVPVRAVKAFDVKTTVGQLTDVVVHFKLEVYKKLQHEIKNVFNIS